MLRSQKTDRLTLTVAFSVLMISVTGNLPAQTLIPLQATLTNSSAKPRANEQLVLWQKSSGKGVAVFVDTLPSVGGQKNLRVEVSGASFRSYSIREASMEPLVLFQDRIVFVRFLNNAPKLHWLDLSNGQEKEFALSFAPISLSASSDAVVAIGYDAANRMHLAMIDAEAKVRSYPFLTTPQRELRSTLFSLNGEGEPILVDCTNATFSTLTIQNGTIQESSPIPLSGPELDDSRRRSPQTGRLRSRLVLGHVAGSQMFLLGPYREREGYRLVAVDGQGKQTGSFRLQISGAGNFVLTPNPLSSDSEHLMLAAMDGTIRQYQRPE